MNARGGISSDFARTVLADELRSFEGQPTSFQRAVIDSRLVQPGDLFVALPGEHADGHDYAADAVSRGAVALIVDHDVPGTESAARFIVNDPLTALQQLAVGWRDSLRTCEVVGVTGNVGKSTTKLITAAVLAQRYRVQVNEANYNNEIGVPLCLLELRPDTERAVIEMGMYTTGEIALLCSWTRPRVGIVLNVGSVHLERAGSLDAIARAKRELPESLTVGGHAILNADDQVVRAMREYTSARVWFFGEADGADVRGSEVDSHGAKGFEFTLSYRGDSAHVHVPLPGAHLLSNVLAAAAAGIADGIPLGDIVAALEALDIPTRLAIRELPGGVTLLDDTYNASPVATIAALNLLAETPGRRLALLGDMLELGELAEPEHDRVGAHAAGICDLLFSIGDLGRRISSAAAAAGHMRATHCESKDDAVEALRKELQPGDVLLVKASRALALETVVQALQGDTR